MPVTSQRVQGVILAGKGATAMSRRRQRTIRTGQDATSSFD